MDALIDYCSVTFPDSYDLALLQVLVCGTSQWDDLHKGFRNYERSARCGNVRVGWSGQNGVHFDIPAQGCRQIDGEHGQGWTDKLSVWRGMGAHFTRLDVAWDDRAGLLDLDEVRGKIEAGELVTRARQASEVTGLAMGDPFEQVGRTIYVGSFKSDTLVRFYDKAAEQGLAEHWVRCEVVWRDRRADAAVDAYIAGGMPKLAGALLAHLRFIEGSGRSRRSNETVWSVWEVFLEQAAKARLVVQRVVRTMEKVWCWFDRSLAPSLALLLATQGGARRILRTLEESRARWGPSHRAVLREYKAALALGGAT